MVELSTKPKEVKKDEKILPAKLPAVWIRHVLKQCLDAFIQSLVTLNDVTSIIIEVRLFLLPVEPHEAVAEVSRIGNV